MPRIRSIKPDFFLDPDLADLKIECRLAFAGLWCQADKDGRLPYEPRKLKALIFPYDNFDMAIILEDLAKKPFINIYEIDQKKYIQVVKWQEHQYVHHTEKDSIIPPFNGEITVKERLLNSNLLGPHTYRQETRDKRQETIPPTKDEVVAYCQEINKSLDLNKWFDFYESKGWMIGKNKMRSWKAALRRWDEGKKDESPERSIYREFKG